jgi:hypothetical protein
VSYESTLPNAKSKAFVSKINILEGVHMNQKWGSHEGSLQRLEGNFNFNTPHAKG